MKFVKHEVPVDFAAAEHEWQEVVVPHCYNAIDGQNGKAIDGGYYRGPAWYRRAGHPGGLEGQACVHPVRGRVSRR